MGIEFHKERTSIRQGTLKYTITYVTRTSDKEGKNHSRFIPDTNNYGFLIMMLFDIVKNFDILPGRTVIGKVFIGLSSLLG